MVDVTVASLVLVLGMRRPAGTRLPWLFLGGGLLVLSVTDSTYVSLTAAGSFTAGSPLNAGWLLAFMLIALATIAPVSSAATTSDRRLSRVHEFLPGLPFVAALAISAGKRIDPAHDRILFWSGVVCLAAFAVRQVLIVNENMALNADLEAKVDKRTAQLRALEQRFRSLVQNSSDIITVIDGQGLVIYQSPSVSTVLGYQPGSLKRSD